MHARQATVFRAPDPTFMREVSRWRAFRCCLDGVLASCGMASGSEEKTLHMNGHRGNLGVLVWMGRRLDKGERLD
jgi:hypothetical protein